MRVKQNEPAGVSYPLLPPLWSQQEAQPRECKECSWNKNNRKYGLMTDVQPHLSGR